MCARQHLATTRGRQEGQWQVHDAEATGKQIVLCLAEQREIDTSVKAGPAANQPADPAGTGTGNQHLLKQPNIWVTCQ